MGFNVGDRVKYVENLIGYEPSAVEIGMLGTIEDFHDSEVIVNLDMLGPGYEFDAKELELV